MVPIVTTSQPPPKGADKQEGAHHNSDPIIPILNSPQSHQTHRTLIRPNKARTHTLNDRINNGRVPPAHLLDSFLSSVVNVRPPAPLNLLPPLWILFIRRDENVFFCDSHSFFELEATADDGDGLC